MLSQLRGYGWLYAKTVEHGGYREGMLCRGQLRGCFRTERYNNFTPAVPASAERGTSRLSSCSVVLRPPVSELLVPAFHVSGAAGADMGSPYGGMLLRVHCDLLLPCSYHRC